MYIYISGLASGYEPEHLIRMFYPGAQLLNTTPTRQQAAALVRVRAGRSRLFVGVRTEQGHFGCTAPLPTPPEDQEYAVCRMIYQLLQQVTGIRPPWGMMTGVRPVRIIHDHRAKGESEEEIQALFRGTYDCTPEKFQLARSIADLQRPIIAANQPMDYSLYIGIPFCPSRCSYCSFVSLSVEREKKHMQPYVDALCQELEAFKVQADACGLNLKTIYIGGGTPTSLSAQQLRQLMGKVKELYDLSALEEYTVEAGRPDCTDAEKLAVLKEYGATRISINPQTFNDEVLARIGRKHTAQDILDCFAQARAAGHTNINMDLIAGLPGDTVESFEHSLRQAIALSPENITVHTLTLKRASNLVIGHQQQEYADVAAMLDKCSTLAEAGYLPYYLYRQKNTLQNLENTGWCKPGYEGLYNIYIMEEVHTILSAGAGGSTKLRQPHGDRIDRIFNYKYPQDYLDGFQKILEKKKGVSDFYARYLASETSGGNQPGQCGGGKP